MTAKYTWLPASNADTDESLHIVKAEGSYLYTAGNQKIYDVISSWWCKPLGHRHDIVINSITHQLGNFEHHIPANCHNDVIEELSFLLLGMFTSMDKVMYASDGSSVVEIAMKLSYESRVINKEPERFKHIALSGGYHGETIFTLSVCGIEGYKKSYKNLLSENYFISGIPYVNSRFDPEWEDCAFDYVGLEGFFIKAKGHATALIIEPVVQGAVGLKIISKDFLVKLILLAQKHGIHIICDEIMVGLGRLGYFSVTKELLGIEPDFVCFAKNLTAGSIPMSAVIINQKITDLFRRDGRIFAHSHTHSCNALAASVAVAYIKFLQNSDLLEQVQKAETLLLEMMRGFSQEFSFIENPRAIGAIAACDLALRKDIIDHIFKIGIENGIYLRPISNVLYILPPLYNIYNDINEIEIKLKRVLINLSNYL